MRLNEAIQCRQTENSPIFGRIANNATCGFEIEFMMRVVEIDDAVSD